jgi:hypothetical protein
MLFFVSGCYSLCFSDTDLGKIFLQATDVQTLPQRAAAPLRYDLIILFFSFAGLSPVGIFAAPGIAVVD